MKQNVAITTHAKQRILERVGSKKIALELLRTAPLSWREEGNIVVRKNGELRFVIEEMPKYWKLITVLNDAEQPAMIQPSYETN